MGQIIITGLGIITLIYLIIVYFKTHKTQHDSSKV